MRELEGALLDAAVAKALGATVTWLEGEGPARWQAEGGEHPLASFSRTWAVRPFSSDWCDGGPLIERELTASASLWAACCRNGASSLGQTALIAAMRALVASKLGDEIDLD